MKERLADLDDTPEVPRTWHQLGILLLDGSGSMTDICADKITKADAVAMAVKELLGRMKHSRVATNFSIAVVTFDTTATIHTQITPVTESDDYGDYNPLEEPGRGTDIGAALSKAQEVAQQFLIQTNRESVPRGVVMVLMSDGMHQTGPDPLQIAEQIKQNPQIKICTTLFAATNVDETEAAEAETLLRNLASSPKQYRTTYRAADLRKFFTESVSVGTSAKIG